MATINEIYNFIDGIAPFSLQMSFDNAGLLIGRGERAVTKVLVALDITEEIAKEAVEIGAELIVAHHPIIFHPLKSVSDADPVGRTILTMVEGGIGAICAHTNLDVSKDGVNDALAQALGLNEIQLFLPGGQLENGDSYGLGRIGTVDKVKLSEFADTVKLNLGANGVRMADGGQMVHRVAVGGGACAGHVKDALAMGCDTFVTSDVKYNDFLDAQAMGLNLIDAGHYPTEQVICPVLVSKLQAVFRDIEVVETKCHREVCQYV